MHAGFNSRFDRRLFLQGSLAAGLAAFSPSLLIGSWKEGDSPLKVLTETPRNAEPVLQDLIADWMTPTAGFYVRSHAPNPKIDPKAFRLTVEGLVEKPLEIPLAELQEKFKKQSVVTTLTCAGNRRAEFNAEAPVGGVQWGPGAIGNAQFGGVRLSEVLKMAGVKSEAKHVWFEGLDEIPQGESTIPFGGSIPLTKAMADSDAMPGAMLSFEMNEQPLTPDHGFPLRSVVPGYIGARSVKWLGKIVVSNRPSPNHYVAGAYKLVREDTPLAWDEAPVLYNYLVNSVIASPSAKAKLTEGGNTIRGYALPSGNGGKIAKVEVSANAGKTWHKAKLLSPAKPYCWVLWEAKLRIGKMTEQLWVKATDSSGAGQPQTVPWNRKGYMNNSWHSVPVTFPN